MSGESLMFSRGNPVVFSLCCGREVKVNFPSPLPIGYWYFFPLQQWEINKRASAKKRENEISNCEKYNFKWMAEPRMRTYMLSQAVKNYCCTHEMQMKWGIDFTTWPLQQQREELSCYLLFSISDFCTHILALHTYESHFFLFSIRRFSRCGGRKRNERLQNN